MTKAKNLTLTNTVFFVSLQSICSSVSLLAVAGEERGRNKTPRASQRRSEEEANLIPGYDWEAVTALAAVSPSLQDSQGRRKRSKLNGQSYASLRARVWKLARADKAAAFSLVADRWNKWCLDCRDSIGEALCVKHISL